MHRPQHTLALEYPSISRRTFPSDADGYLVPFLILDYSLTMWVVGVRFMGLHTSARSLLAFRSSAAR